MVGGTIVRRRCPPGAVPTCAYVTTAPWKSRDECTSAFRKLASSSTPTRAAAPAHCVLRCSVGPPTVTASTVRSASSSAAIRNANVVLPAPGVATARKSADLRRRYSPGAWRRQAGRGGSLPGARRGELLEFREGRSQAGPLHVQATRKRPRGGRGGGSQHTGA